MLRILCVFILACAVAFAQLPGPSIGVSSAGGSGGGLPTNCSDVAGNIVCTGPITAAGIEMPPGTEFVSGGACVDPANTTLLPSPAAGEYTLFLDSTNSCHLSSISSARAVVDLQAGGSSLPANSAGYLENDGAGGLSWGAGTGGATGWVAAPATTHDNDTGTYNNDPSVTVGGCSGGTKYISEDGTTVAAYSTPVSVTATGTVLKSRCLATGLDPSSVKSSTYTLTVATPSDSPGAGSYSGTQSVTLADTTTGAYLCYTVDGGTPAGTASSCSTGTHYTGAISVAATSTVKAKGYKANYNASAEHSAAYTITVITPIRGYASAHGAGANPASGAFTTVANDWVIGVACSTGSLTLGAGFTEPTTSGYGSFADGNCLLETKQASGTSTDTTWTASAADNLAIGFALSNNGGTGFVQVAGPAGVGGSPATAGSITVTTGNVVVACMSTVNGTSPTFTMSQTGTASMSAWADVGTGVVWHSGGLSWGAQCQYATVTTGGSLIVMGTFTGGSGGGRFSVSEWNR